MPCAKKAGKCFTLSRENEDDKWYFILIMYSVALILATSVTDCAEYLPFSLYLIRAEIQIHSQCNTENTDSNLSVAYFSRESAQVRPRPTGPQIPRSLWVSPIPQLMHYPRASAEALDRSQLLKKHSYVNTALKYEKTFDSSLKAEGWMRRGSDPRHKALYL